MLGRKPACELIRELSLPTLSRHSLPTMHGWQVECRLDFSSHYPSVGCPSAEQPAQLSRAAFCRAMSSLRLREWQCTWLARWGLRFSKLPHHLFLLPSCPSLLISSFFSHCQLKWLAWPHPGTKMLFQNNKLRFIHLYLILGVISSRENLPGSTLPLLRDSTIKISVIISLINVDHVHTTWWLIAFLGLCLLLNIFNVVSVKTGSQNMCFSPSVCSIHFSELFNLSC